MLSFVHRPSLTMLIPFVPMCSLPNSTKLPTSATCFCGPPLTVASEGIGGAHPGLEHGKATRSGAAEGERIEYCQVVMWMQHDHALWVTKTSSQLAACPGAKRRPRKRTIGIDRQIVFQITWGFVGPKF